MAGSELAHTNRISQISFISSVLIKTHNSGVCLQVSCAQKSEPNRTKTAMGPNTVFLKIGTYQHKQVSFPMIPRTSMIACYAPLEDTKKPLNSTVLDTLQTRMHYKSVLKVANSFASNFSEVSRKILVPN